jgi:hypothetical protein
MFNTNLKKYFFLFVLLLLALFLFGCTAGTDLTIPPTEQMIMSLAPDINVTQFNNGDYNNLCLQADNNHLAFGSCADTNAVLDWDNIFNFPTGCAAGQAVQVIGTTLTCIDIPSDTNFQTAGYTAAQILLDTNYQIAGYDFNDYAKLDSSNQPFTGNVVVPSIDIGDFLSVSDDGTNTNFDLTNGEFNFSGGDVRIQNNERIRARITTGAYPSLFYINPFDQLIIGPSTSVTGTRFYGGGSTGIDLDNSGNLKLNHDNQILNQGAGNDYSQYFNGVLQRVDSPYWKIHDDGRWDIHTIDRYNLFIGEDAGDRISDVGSTGSKNIGLGWHSLYKLSTGSNNFALGYNTGGQMQGGSQNSYIGVLSGISNVNGNFNTGVGYGTMYTGTGSNNVAVGSATLYGVAAGNDNIGIGYNTGYAAAGASQNVFIGNATGYATTANNNTFVGTENGRYNTTGTRNVFLGYRAGYGTGGTGTGGYNTVLGSRAGYQLSTGTNNIFLGYNTGYSQTSNSNLLIVDNQQRATTTDDLTDAIIYGIMATNPEDQDLKLNADVFVKNDLNVDGNIYTNYVFAKNQVLQTHNTDTVVADTEDTWENLSWDLLIDSETDEKWFEFIDSNQAIQIKDFSGVVRVQGCVHPYNNNAGNQTATIRIRVLIDDVEARCLQASQTKEFKSSGIDILNYIGTIAVEPDSIIEVQWQTTNDAIELRGDTVFDNPVSASVNLEKISGDVNN